MPTTAFLFPGQGSQYVGMGRKLYDEFTIAKRYFEEANDTLGFNLTELCFESSHSQLMQTMNTQPAILAVSVIAFEIGRIELGWEPDYMAGHSLGEYSALVCSGVLSFGDGLRIVRKRGMLMQAAHSSDTGAMVAVTHAASDQLEEFCRQASNDTSQVVIACYNSLNQHVLAGHQAAVQSVVERLQAQSSDVSVKYLNVSAPFHSPLMQSAAEQLAVELEKLETKDPRWPVISNVVARPYGRQELLPLLYRQMTQPVRWLETMQYLNSQGICRTVEVGPRQVLTRLMKDTYPSVQTCQFDHPEQLEELRAYFDEGKNDREVVIASIRESLTAAIIARNRNHDAIAYSTGVIQPIQQIRDLIEKLADNDSSDIMQTLIRIKSLLQSVMSTKQLPLEEQMKITDKLPANF
ncbi:Malonyl CoA-acyl carrier protein transacylase [Paenibacillus sp. JJ-100]|uniref:ACP S-malonyltransferase n=1 Tax=Paenibacillus sp. JJ-100 TaxID=2974896 RepID=UPI0022FF9ED7|nr:ACP S-malonyltransferase [Paenibacillus sp. JJ-100]CAI6068627.1 Malonyl CoA-acyl carrier protein transacylase [Paenibacillus sp. JJ-100]